MLNEMDDIDSRNELMAALDEVSPDSVKALPNSVKFTVLYKSHKY